MTTPAIATLLESHAALLASRELSFDEKVGYLTAALLTPTQQQPTTWNCIAISGHAAQIRTALIERQNAQLKALAAQAPKPAPDKERARGHVPAPLDSQQLTSEIQRERESIALISENLNQPNALENLQLHINRLRALERKRT